MQKAVRRVLRTYSPFAANAVKDRMSYKLPFFIHVVGQFLTILITYYLWAAIYGSSPNDVIQGFTLPEMASYVIISYLTTTLLNHDAMTVGHDVQDGSIASSLVLPINYFGRKFSEALGELAFNFVLVFLPAFVLFSVTGFIPFPGIGTVLLYLLSLLLSLGNMFLFDMLFGMFAFYTTYFWGINLAKQVVQRALSGALIPLSFFPAAVETALRLLPFASMNYTPVMIYLQKLTSGELYAALAVQLVWIFILLAAANLLWRRAIRKLTILGG